MTEELIKRTTITELVNQWRQAEAEIRQAFALLVTAEKRLRDAFKPNSYSFDLSSKAASRYEYREYDKPELVLKELKKDVWRSLVDRMELRRILSVKRCEELNKQLETGEGLPEVDEASIIAMMEQTYSNVPQLIEEAVKEVFDWLRPQGWLSEYKTNTQFEVGQRVILHCLESWGNSTFRVSYYHEPNLTALDNVFHALDGNGTVKTTRGPLVDAINATPKNVGKGDTDYFRFKCFKNQNLHIEFKRMDLVAKLNQVAGGMRLKP